MTRKYHSISVLLVAATMLVMLGSCNPSGKYEKQEKDSINNYLTTNQDKQFTKEPSGLYYLEVLAGTGRTPVPHDTAFITYTGKYLNGNVFDTNVGEALWPFIVGEGYAIAGLDEGVQYMKEGGKATLLVPSSLAYGSTGYSIIPGYTPLLFEVELVKIKLGPAK